MPIDWAEFERRRAAGELSDQELSFIEDELGRFQEKVGRNPLNAFQPYPKQQRYLGSRAFRRAFVAGNGAGKSIVGTADDLIQLLPESAVPEHLRGYKIWEPPVPMRIVAPKLNVIEGVVLEKFRELTPKEELLGGSFDKAYDKVYRRLRFKCGSYVLFNTVDQDRDAHAGVEVRRVRFDEEPEGEHGRGIYTENLARLRAHMPDAQVCFTMTPLLGLTWVADELEKEGSFVVTASMRDNPFINAEAMIAELGHLSELEREAVIEGKFVHFAGAVLSMYDETKHLVDAPSIGHVRSLDTIIGIDPGMTQGGVLWSGFDGDNAMLTYDELYPRGLSVPAIADRIVMKNAAWGLGTRLERDMAVERFRDQVMRDELTPDERDQRARFLERAPAKPILYVIDPTARNRSLTDAEKVEGLFQRCGIHCLPGQNDRETGILQMRARLESQAWLISRECVNLRHEFKRWLVAKDELTQQGTAKVKGAGGTFATIGPDHLCDPARYTAMERVWYQPRKPVRRQQWSMSSGMTPPKHLVLGGRKRGSYGPLGSHG